MSNPVKIKDNQCQKCGSTKSLVNHHISYIPEIFTTFCRSCDRKAARKPKTRGFTILKVYPQSGMVRIPKDFCNEFGDLIELYSPSSFPVALVFKYGLPLKDIGECLNRIFTKDIRFRRDIQERQSKK